MSQATLNPNFKLKPEAGFTWQQFLDDPVQVSEMHAIKVWDLGSKEISKIITESLSDMAPITNVTAPICMPSPNR